MFEIFFQDFQGFLCFIISETFHDYSNIYSKTSSFFSILYFTSIQISYLQNYKLYYEFNSYSNHHFQMAAIATPKKVFDEILNLLVFESHGILNQGGVFVLQFFNFQNSYVSHSFTVQIEVVLFNLLFCINFSFGNIVFSYIMVHQCHNSPYANECKGGGLMRVSNLYLIYVPQNTPTLPRRWNLASLCLNF